MRQERTHTIARWRGWPPATPLALDGAVRGLPKRPPVVASGPEPLGIPRIVSVRQTKTIWNAARSGSLGSTPLADSIFLAQFGCSDNNFPTNFYQTQFGGWQSFPVAMYGNGVISNVLAVGLPRRVAAFTPNASFDFDGPSTTARTMTLMECVVEDFRGIPRLNGASAPYASSCTVTGYRRTEAPGGIAIIGWQFDDGGSGLTSIDNVTLDENKGSSVAAALGGLVVGNLTSNDGSSFSARCNAGRTDNWSGVVAVLE